MSKLQGLFEPIIVNEKNQILDGRHRYRALIGLGKSPYSQVASFEEAIRNTKELTEEQFIYDSNIHRRHLTDDQRVMLAAEFLPYIRVETAAAKSAARIPKGKTGNPGGKPKAEVSLKSLTKRPSQKKSSIPGSGLRAQGMSEGKRRSRNSSWNYSKGLFARTA